MPRLTKAAAGSKDCPLASSLLVLEQSGGSGIVLTLLHCSTTAWEPNYTTAPAPLI
jgi:hypothetical protein